jgi:uncharacterized protein YjbI with pentapeptide repeats
MKFKRIAIICFGILVLGNFTTSLGINWSWVKPWTGFFEYTTKKTVEKDPQGKSIKFTEENQTGKTLWDWLQLAGIPFVLAGGGYLLNQREEERDEKRKEAEQNRAAENLREEALQTYFSRISELLLEHKLSQLEQNNNPARDIARARTLTVLSRLDRDGQRKAAIVNFLHEAKLIKGREPIINLSRADLSGAILDGADLSNANLSNTDLSNANLRGADLRNAFLSGTKLSNAILSNTILGNAEFMSADLSGVNLSGATLDDEFLNAILGKTGKTAFSFEINLNGAKLCGANLNNAKLKGAKLSEANLFKAELSGANLSNAILGNADLRNTDLSNAILSDAYLGGANLIGANLRNADLSYSDLNRTNFSEANLSNANLSNTDLSNAWLSRADLSGANIRGAYIRVGLGVDQDRIKKIQLDQAKLCKTTLPDGTVSNRDCDR